MKFHYFISYAHEHGFGNCEIVLDGKIYNYQDFLKISNMIKESAEGNCMVCKNPIVLFYQLLSTEEGGVA